MARNILQLADDWAGNGLRGMEKSLSFGLAVPKPGTLTGEVGSADNIIITIIIIIMTYLTRVNRSAEAVINGHPGQLKKTIKGKITATD